MTTLFELPPADTSASPLDGPPGKTCLTCEHRERHQCGGSIIQYCGKRSSNRTANGQLKIKCKTKACLLYEQILKP